MIKLGFFKEKRLVSAERQRKQQASYIQREATIKWKKFYIAYVTLCFGGDRLDSHPELRHN